MSRGRDEALLGALQPMGKSRQREARELATQIRLRMAQSDRQGMENALDAYLRLLEGKGAAEGVVQFRRSVLSRLIQILHGQEHSATVYRSAVDALLTLCSPEDRPGAMSAAREYYYFWIGDVKKVSELNAKAGFTTHHVRLPVLASFEDLQQKMAAARFTDFPPSLSLYLGQLYELGAEEEVLSERGELLKSLLFLLHEQPHHPDSYRMAVDAMLLHLSDSFARETFLAIGREFFYFWMSFPDAEVRERKPR